MKNPRKWRSVAAAVALAAAGSMVLVSSNGVAAEQGSSSSGGSAEWAGSWATALTAANATGSTQTGFTNQSIRMIVHTSIGGEKLRIRLSNLYGTKNIKVGHATVAKPNTATPELSDVDPATLRDLTFNGSAETTMLKGAELYSDPVDLRVRDLEDLVVSVYFPEATGPTSFHGTSRQTNFTGPADLSTQAGGADFTPRNCCWFFVSGVDVLRKKPGGSIVVLGDSIGDGFSTTLNANKRWTDQLAERLVDRFRNGRVPGVLNVSLSGNRVAHDGTDPILGSPGFNELGASAPARLNEDVFAQTGVETVIVHLGVNDIWMLGESADVIIDSLRQINTQVQEKGLRMLVSTISPYEGYPAPGAWTPEKEQTRQAVNSYLRGSHEFTALIDFDKLLRDPAAPGKLRPEFDSGDHIHPNDAGNEAMADLIPLHLVS